MLRSLTLMCLSLHIVSKLIFATEIFRHGHRNPATVSTDYDQLFIQYLNVTLEDSQA